MDISEGLVRKNLVRHGVDDAGREVASGIYFYHFMVGTGTQSGKLTILR